MRYGIIFRMLFHLEYCRLTVRLRIRLGIYPVNIRYFHARNTEDSIEHCTTSFTEPKIMVSRYFDSCVGTYYIHHDTCYNTGIIRPAFPFSALKLPQYIFCSHVICTYVSEGCNNCCQRFDVIDISSTTTSDW